MADRLKFDNLEDLIRESGIIDEPPEITKEMVEESLIPELPKSTPELRLQDVYPEIETEMMEPDMSKVADQTNVATKDPRPRHPSSNLDTKTLARKNAIMRKAARGLTKTLPIAGGLMTLIDEAKAGSSMPEALGKAAIEEISPVPVQELVVDPAKAVYRDITKSDEDREDERKKSREAILNDLLRRRNEG